MNWKKKALASLLLICLCGILFGGNENNKAFADLQKRYPDADTILLSDEESITYQPDGTDETVDDYCYLIMNEAGRSQLRELSFFYNAAYETFSISRLQLIKNGTNRIITLDQNKIAKLTTDSDGISDNIFDNNSKKLSISIPGLEIGDKLLITTVGKNVKTPTPGHWQTGKTLQSSDPIQQYRFTVKAPPTRPLKKFQVKNPVTGSIKFKERKDASGITYVWEVRDVPQIFPENQMPDASTCVQRVLASTFQDWREVSRWYWSLCEPHLTKISPEMQEQVRTLSKKHHDRQELLRAIFAFVSRGIHYTGVINENAAPGFEPHDVCDTFARKHGVCRDKAALLTAMLRLAGFDAVMVLIHSGEPVDPEVPMVRFDHAICAVKENGKYLLMDSTDEDTAELLPTYLADKSYLPATRSGEELMRTDKTAASINSTQITTAAVLGADAALTGETTIKFSGLADVYFRGILKESTPTSRREHFNQFLQFNNRDLQIQSLKFSPQNLEDMGTNLTVKIVFSAGHNWNDHPGLQTIFLPYFHHNIGWFKYFLTEKITLEKRQYPVKTFPFEVREKLVMKLPDNLQVSALPLGISLTEKGLGTFNSNIVKKGRELTAETYFSLNTHQVMPAEYPALRRLAEAYQRRNQQGAVVRYRFPPDINVTAMRNYFPGADYVFLDCNKNITQTEKEKWLEEKHLRVLVLNKSGIDTWSNYSLYFNPDREKITITAEVTPPDNQTPQKLLPREITILDQDDTAGTPRYTTRKILNASLPAVQIGSVIDLRIRKEITSPGYFSTFLVLREQVPALHRQMTVDYLKGREVNYAKDRLNLRVTREESPDRVKLTFISEDPMYVPEEINQVPFSWQGATAFFTNVNLRREGMSLRKKLEEKASGPAEELYRTIPILKQIGEIPAGPPEKRRQKITMALNELHRTIERKVLTRGPSLDDISDRELSTPLTTWQDGYGHSADKAILYAALLKQLKIEYQWFAVSNHPAVPQYFLVLKQNPTMLFEKVLLYIPEAGMYLNDGNSLSHPGTIYSENRIALDLNSGHLSEVQPRENFCSWTREETTIALAPDDSALLTIKKQFYGEAHNAMAERYNTKTPEYRKRFFIEAALQLDAMAELQEYYDDFSKYPGTICWKVRIPLFLKKYDDRFYSFKLPNFADLHAEIIAVNEPRLTPYLLNKQIHVKKNFTITMPRGYYIHPTHEEAETLKEILNTNHYYREQYLREKDCVKLNYRLKLPPTIIIPPFYQAFFEIKRYLGNPALATILISKEK